MIRLDEVKKEKKEREKLKEELEKDIIQSWI